MSEHTNLKGILERLTSSSPLLEPDDSTTSIEGFTDGTGCDELDTSTIFIIGIILLFIIIGILC